MCRIFCHMVINVIKIYQWLTKNRPPKCLHYPSCSNYAILAFKKYPFLIATKKTINRLRDCNPFSKRSYIDYP
ncbi:membrane protein insertion efficiency factor YidD [Desulfocucumis palustris]|uniref:membrane protein insertion efficiency factor YidD n=1 Tax=Desulfocucumis palustris TaxID=1898651 RepID=UPI0027D78160|nr:membrane protein insertion efficiency factor YidD [Desulfocucumis palustris]